MHPRLKTPLEARRPSGIGHRASGLAASASLRPRRLQERAPFQIGIARITFGDWRLSPPQRGGFSYGYAADLHTAHLTAPHDLAKVSPPITRQKGGVSAGALRASKPCLPRFRGWRPFRFPAGLRFHGSGPGGPKIRAARRPEGGERFFKIFEPFQGHKHFYLPLFPELVLRLFRGLIVRCASIDLQSRIG